MTRNISVNLATNVWSALLLFVATPFFVSLLGVESYGLIGFYLSLLAIVGILDTGISATAVREVAWLDAREDEKRNIPSLLWSLEVVYWGIVLILGGLVLMWAWVWGENWFQTKELLPEQMRTALMLMAASLVVQVPSGLYLGGLMGLQRQVEASTFMAFFSTLRVVGALMVLWLFEPDIKNFFVWQILASILQTGGMRWMLWRHLNREGTRAPFSSAAIMSISGFAVGMTMITALTLLLSQADKLLLSRFVPLDVFGFYMLAWAVASGFSRVATPLVQAFGPHFTELVSQGREKELANKVRLASQVLNVVILPPALLVILLAEPILTAWTGNPAVADPTAPILMVVTVGTVFTSCSYPALSLMYSRKLIRPVLELNMFATPFLLLFLVVAVLKFGVMGAAYFWAAYGFFAYLAFQSLGLHGIVSESIFAVIVRDFVAPCAAVLAIVWPTAWLLKQLESTFQFVLLLVPALLAGWVVALLSSGRLYRLAVERVGWQKHTSP